MDAGTKSSSESRYIKTAIEPMPSDVQLLRDWGQGLDALINRDDLRDGRPWVPSCCDWMRFRPDPFAREAMLRCGATYPEVIGQVREFLQHAETAFAEFLKHDPPIECPSCHKTGYLESSESRPGVLSCEYCGECVTLSPLRDQERVCELMGDALPNLARVILVAADAIEDGQKPDRTSDKSEIEYPRNQNVIDFCKELAGRVPHGHTQAQIAREFVEGTKLKPDSLIRQANRFPHLWKPGQTGQTRQ